MEDIPLQYGLLVGTQRLRSALVGPSRSVGAPKRVLSAAYNIQHCFLCGENHLQAVCPLQMCFQCKEFGHHGSQCASSGTASVSSSRSGRSGRSGRRRFGSTWGHRQQSVRSAQAAQSWRDPSNHFGHTTTMPCDAAQAAQATAATAASSGGGAGGGAGVASAFDFGLSLRQVRDKGDPPPCPSVTLSTLTTLSGLEDPTEAPAGGGLKGSR